MAFWQKKDEKIEAKPIPAVQPAQMSSIMEIEDYDDKEENLSLDEQTPIEQQEPIEEIQEEVKESKEEPLLLDDDIEAQIAKLKELKIQREEAAKKRAEEEAKAKAAKPNTDTTAQINSEDALQAYFASIEARLTKIEAFLFRSS